MTLNSPTAMSNRSHTLEAIRKCLQEHLPKGGTAFLFGSQARGTAHSGSDWDILVLLQKDTLEPSDYDNVTFPLTMLGWDLGEDISPVMYTTREWEKYKITPFYKNIEKEGIKL